MYSWTSLSFVSFDNCQLHIYYVQSNKNTRFAKKTPYITLVLPFSRVITKGDTDRKTEIVAIL